MAVAGQHPRGDAQAGVGLRAKAQPGRAVAAWQGLGFQLIIAAPLDKVANHEKTMPANFLRKDGYGITAAARTYLEPLIRGESPPPYGRDGMPKYVTLKNVAVKKKLPAWEG